MLGNYREGHDESVALGPICAAEKKQHSLQEQAGHESSRAGREYWQVPLCRLKSLDAHWNLVGTGCCGDVWGGGGEMGAKPRGEGRGR